MMKSWRIRGIGIIVCLSMILSSSYLVSFAEGTGDLDVDKNQTTRIDTASSSGPDTASSSGPDTASPSGPDTVSSSGPDTASPSGPDTASPSDPDTASPSGPDTASSSDPDTASSSDPEGVEGGNANPNIDDLTDEERFDLEAEVAKSSELTIQSGIHPLEVETGSSATLVVAITYSKKDTSIPLEADRVKAILRTPAGVIVKVEDNQQYTETHEIDPMTGETVTTITLSQLTGYGGGGMNFANLLIPNGVTAHGTELPITLAWVYGDEALGKEVPLNKPDPNSEYPMRFTVTAKSEQFEWSELKSGAAPASIPLNEEKLALPEIVVSYSIKNKHEYANLSSVYTDTVLIEELVNVDEKVKLTVDALSGHTWTHPNGITGEATVDPQSYHDAEETLVKTFLVTYKVTNESLGGATPAELKSMAGSIKLHINGAELDAEKMKAAFGEGSTETQLTFKAFESTALGAAAVPFAAVGSSLAADGRQLLQSDDRFSVTVDYTRTIETPDDPEDPRDSQGINKEVTQILGLGGDIQKSDTGGNRTEYAYPGETVTYRLFDFGNKLKRTPLDEFKVVDILERDDMYPLEITTGHYGNAPESNRYVLRVYTDTGSGEKLSFQRNVPFSSAETISLNGESGQKGNVTDGHFPGAAIDPLAVTRIEFGYGWYLENEAASYAGDAPVKPNAVPAGFAVSAPPTVTAKVKNTGEGNVQPGEVSGDPSLQPKVVNTAELSYSVTAPGDEQGVKTSYNADTEGAQPGEYRIVREITYYATPEAEGGNKRGVKLYGAAPNNPVIANGDLIEYTVSFSNGYANNDGYVSNPFIDDQFSGMKPYVEDPDGKLAHYGTPHFIKVAKVTDRFGNAVDNHNLTVEDYFTGAKPDGDPRSDNEPRYDSYDPDKILRVRLHGKMEYGWTVSVSYVMEVTDKDNLSNQFAAWAYPPGSGNQSVSIGGGGWKPGPGGKAEVVVPTLTFTLDYKKVTDSGVGNTPNSAANALTKGDTVRVTLTLQNSNDEDQQNVLPVHFYGALARTEAVPNSTQDVLRFPEDGKATVQYYKRGAEGATETFADIAAAKPSDVWYFGGGANAQNFPYGVSFPLGADAPLTLGYHDKVTIEYDMVVAEDGDGAIPNLYQNFQAHFMIGEEYNYYSVNQEQGAVDTYYNLDDDDATRSSIDAGKHRVYVKKSDIYYVGITQKVTANPINLNGNVPSGANPSGRPERSYLEATIHNYSAKTIEIDKVYFRMPKHETFYRTLYPEETNTIKARLLTDTLFGPANDQRQIVVVTQKNDEPMQISAGGTATFRLLTYMTPEQVAASKAEMAAPSGSANISTLDTNFQVAFHIHDESEVRPTNQKKIVALTEDELSDWGGSNLGTKNGLYRSESATPVRQRWRYPIPGLKVTPYRLYTNGEYEAIADNESLGTQANIAWQVDVNLVKDGNSLTALEKALVVVKLPAGFEYEGILNDTVTATKKSILGNDYLIIPLENLSTAAAKSFRIKATVGKSYGPKTLEAVLMTYEEFYRGSPGTLMPKNRTGLPLEELGGDLAGTFSTAVKADNTLNIGGKFAFITSKLVSKIGGTPSSELALDVRDGQSFQYTMTLQNNGADGIPYQDITVIDRLPVDKDYFNWDYAPRGSTAKVTMIQGNHPTVQIQNKDGNPKTLSLGSDYSLDYAVVDPDYRFVYADYGLTDNGSAATDAWSPADRWEDITEATAFRIRLHEDLTAGAALVITYDAQAPEDAIPYQNAIAINTFAAGFKVKLSEVDFQITPESDLARVTFPDATPMVIQGTVFTETQPNVNGVYGDHGNDVPFTQGNVKLELYRDGEDAAFMNTSPKNGFYRFQVFEPGVYYVKIADIPAGYELFDQVVDQEQGNRFEYETGRTPESLNVTYDPKTWSKDAKPVIRNAGVLAEVLGSLVLEKQVDGNSRIGGKNQKFVYEIKYTPVGADAPTKIFYETVLAGYSGARTVDKLPRGTYEVTEVGAWSTGFTQEGTTAYYKGDSAQTGVALPGAQNIQITYNDTVFTAECVNNRFREGFMHAIADAVNYFRNNQGG